MTESPGQNGERALERGLKQLGLPPDLVPPLLGYLDELLRWNRAYNLTAVRDRREAVSRHLLDSLSVLPLLGPGDVLDVGTGPGLPGIVLALALPQRHFVLLDSGIKKIRFVRHAALQLGLDNIEAVHGRIEDYRPAQSFGNVISRAFADTGHFWEVAARLRAPEGRLLAMKGHYPAQELGALPSAAGPVAVHRLDVPGLGAERHVVVIGPQTLAGSARS